MKPIEKKEAQYLLRNLPYEKWLAVGRMMVPKGLHIARISNLEELEWTLRPTAKTLVAIKFENLEKWLRDSIEDIYLADAVSGITSKKELSYVEHSKLVHEEILKRVNFLKSNLEGVSHV